MNELAMTQGVIPVRHPSLPGVVKLPKRYEKAALGDPRTAKHRKVSICSEPARMRETISDRLDDLMTAIMWVKQELILLRQHDILLKRQFFNINDSIQTLHARKARHALSSSSSSSSSSPTYPISILAAVRAGQKPSSPASQNSLPTSPTTNGVVTSNLSSVPESSAVSGGSTPTSPAGVRALLGFKHLAAANSDLYLDTFHLRPSSSATVLTSQRSTGSDVTSAGGDSEEDTDGDDTFEEQYHRPRTSSMKTSRDLAALARRRGSKELNQLI